MDCITCSMTGPHGMAHYHITVANGKVTHLESISANGDADREILRGDYHVYYDEDPRRKKRKRRRGWLKPKLYKGKSMSEEELENT